MIDLKKLVEAGVHFGHHTSRWHPKMRPYIWGARNKTHLINVAKTAFLLDRAEKFLEQAAGSGKDILWVGTKKPAQSIVRSAAEKLNMPSVSHRWIGGTLSNFEQVRKAVTRLLHLRDVQEKSLSRYKKKEQSMIIKETERLNKNVGGIVSMKSLPAAIIVVDAKKEQAVIREANVMNIPVVCLIDTNTDPSGVSYVIPGNDDSPKSIAMIMECLSQAVAKGAKAAAAEAEKAAAKAAAQKEEKAKAAADKKDAASKDAPKKAPAPKATAAKKPAAKADDAKEVAEKAAAPKKAPAKAAAKTETKKAAPKKKAATPKKEEAAATTK